MSDEPDLARWAPVIPLLREFESYLAKDAPRLRIVHANDATWSNEEYLHRRREAKYGSRYGVYLIFNAEDQLRYIGLAMNAFDDRIWAHDEAVSRRWTDVIPFEHGWYFFAPALEFFLIAKLRPPDNKAFSGYSIGERLLAGPMPELGD